MHVGHNCNNPVGPMFMSLLVNDNHIYYTCHVGESTHKKKLWSGKKIMQILQLLNKVNDLYMCQLDECVRPEPLH